MLINPGIRGSVYQTIDKSTYHKLEKVSTKAGEDLYTITKINNLLNIVDRILHGKWKKDTVKLDTIYLQLQMLMLTQPSMQH